MIALSQQCPHSLGNYRGISWNVVIDSSSTLPPKAADMTDERTESCTEDIHNTEFAMKEKRVKNMRWAEIPVLLVAIVKNN